MKQQSSVSDSESRVTACHCVSNLTCLSEPHLAGCPTAESLVSADLALINNSNHVVLNPECGRIVRWDQVKRLLQGGHCSRPSTAVVCSTAESDLVQLPQTSSEMGGVCDLWVCCVQLSHPGPADCSE